jgi:uncharacterized protein (TIGR04255 family)
VPLPDYERVIYERNPLVDVICQVRFPPILKIDTELPAAFQEAIRADFPVLTEKPGGENALALPPEVVRDIPPQFAEQIGALGSAFNTKKAYSFASDDDGWVTVLSRDSLSLTANQYRQWPDFRGRLQLVLEALGSTYRPAHFSRVGLRYRDLICRSALGLDDVPWSDLLEPHIAGEFTSEDIASDITLAARQLLFRLSEVRGQVRLQHGIATKDGSDEPCFLIDADYFSTELTEVTDVWGLLEGLHSQAGRLFRWCIRDRLHVALDPRVPV